MKKVLIIPALALLMVPIMAFGATNLKLAVVDVQDVIDNIEEGKKAKSQLEIDQNNKKKDIEEKQKELQKMQQDFERQRLILSQEALAEKQMKMQEKYRDLQTAFYKSSDELQKKYNDFLVGIYRKIESVVAKIAKENNYSMVLEKGDGKGVMYALPTYDITKTVVTTYNKVYPMKKDKK